MKKMTLEQIEKKKNYIREQLDSGSGIYSTLFIRTYYYILCCCRKNQNNWCYGKDVGDDPVARYAYAAVRDGRPDHMGGEIIYKIKQELNAMGYISFKMVDNVWRIYINRELDFLDCNIEDLIFDQPENCAKNKTQIAKEILDYLCTDGINIYSFDRECWKCHQITQIYSYYLDVQIKHGMNPSYELFNSNLRPKTVIEAIINPEPKNLFSTIGIGIIPKIDVQLSKKISFVDKKYSKTMQKAYYMNLCKHCQATQGVNYTVFHSAELESLSNKELNKKIAFKLSPQKCSLCEDDLIRFIE